MLLICAALAVVQVGVSLALAPLLVSLPALSPPLYAVVAGVHALMVFLAPRVTGARWSATVTAVIAGLVMATVNPIGVLITVVVLIPGVIVDVALLLPPAPAGRRASELRYGLGAVASAVVLFAVSLPVFSPEHLTPAILIGAALGRLVGEGLAYVCARALAAGLVRAGVSPRDR